MEKYKAKKRKADNFPALDSQFLCPSKPEKGYQEKHHQES